MRLISFLVGGEGRGRMWLERLARDQFARVEAGITVLIPFRIASDSRTRVSEHLWIDRNTMHILMDRQICCDWDRSTAD